MSIGNPLELPVSSRKTSLPNLARTGDRREYWEYMSYSEGTSAYGLGRRVNIGRSRPRSEADGVLGRRGIRRLACCGNCCAPSCGKSEAEPERDGLKNGFVNALADTPPLVPPIDDIPSESLDEPSSPPSPLCIPELLPMRAAINPDN